MRPTDTTNWIRLGLFALPLYGVLTFWSSLNPQPDPNTEYEAWSRYVTTDHYVLTHVFGSILGLILAIFGTFALGAYLANARAGRLGLVAMVITVLGSALFLPEIGVSTFSAPEEGQAYLAGIEGLAELPTSSADIAFMVTSLLVVVLLGVAVCARGRCPSGPEPCGLPRQCSCTPWAWCMRRRSGLRAPRRRCWWARCWWW